MIDAIYSRIVRGDIDEKILRWAVWFQTPLGTCESMQEAVELMQKNDLDPRFAIHPISVAISASTHEVWAR